MLIGLVVSDLFGLSSKLDNYAHQNCIRWDEYKPKTSLFALSEVSPLLRKKVISKNEIFRKGETGRIMFLQPVGKDKFMVAVYWGNGTEDEKSNLTFFDKNRFSEELEILD